MTDSIKAVVEFKTTEHLKELEVVLQPSNKTIGYLLVSKRYLDDGHVYLFVPNSSFEIKTYYELIVLEQIVAKLKELNNGQ